MSNFPGQWKLDVNDRYQKAVGIITNMSTLSIVIPILFLRNVLGIGQTQSIADVLSLWVYVSWASLGLSIFSAIMYYFFSAKWVKLAWGKPADIFGKSLTDKFAERILDGSYLIMMTSFVIGFACILVFIVTFTPKVL